MSDESQCQQALLVALKALEAGDVAKAQRFLEKAQRINPASPEVAAFERRMRSASASGAPKPPPPPRSTSDNQPRQRRPAAAPEASTATSSKVEEGTPDQVALVRRVNAAKDYYAVFGLDKSASEDDIKRAYKKLALKLHPDKNKATGAEEAFKKVSKAVHALSDADRRAAYDRFGHEDGPAAAAAARGGGAGGGGGAHGGFHDISPEDIFNMMFNGGFPGGAGFAAGPGFRTYHFNMNNARRQHAQQRARQQQQQEQGGNLVFNPNLVYLGLMGIVFLLQLFGQSGSPPYTFQMDQRYGYTSRHVTSNHRVPYYTQEKYDVQYPEHSNVRRNMEARIDGDFREHLATQCHYERVQRERMRRFGNRQQRQMADNMPLDNCQKLKDHGFGSLDNRRYHQGGW